jgi:hypothetical protein
MLSLLQPLQPALSTDYVLVVPLDLSSFCQPALEILPVDLIDRSVADFGGFEAAFLLQSIFLKRLTTPKERITLQRKLGRSVDLCQEKAYRMPDRAEGKDWTAFHGGPSGASRSRRAGRCRDNRDDSWACPPP